MKSKEILFLVFFISLLSNIYAQHYQSFETTTSKPVCWAGATFTSKSNLTLNGTCKSILEGNRACESGQNASGLSIGSPNWLRTAQFALSGTTTSEWISVWYRSGNFTPAQVCNYKIWLENQTTLALTGVSPLIIVAGTTDTTWMNAKYNFPNVVAGNYKLVFEAITATNRIVFDAFNSSVNINGGPTSTDVSIGISSGSLCDFGIKTFVANVSNPASTLRFKWLVNHDSVGTTDTYTGLLTTGDSIWVSIYTIGPNVDDCPTIMNSAFLRITACSGIITINSLSQHTICQGQTTGVNIAYTASVAGTPTYTAELSNLNSKSFSATPLNVGSSLLSPINSSFPNSLSIGKYYIRVRASSGEISTNLDSIVVVAKDIVTVLTDTTVCYGTPAYLRASTGVSFKWSTNAASATTKTISVIPLASDDYAVTITDPNGCQTQDHAHVTVVANPVAAAGVNKVICLGDTASITGTGVGNYLWSNSATTATIKVNPNIGTNYILRVTNSYTCKDTASVYVTVNPRPNAGAGIDQTVCNGTQVTLTATGIGNYNWSTGQTSQTIQTTPSATTDYTLTVTNSFSCSDKDTVIVNINPLPIVNAGKDTSILYNTQVLLNATASNVSYLWSPADSLNSSAIQDPLSIKLHKTIVYTLLVEHNTTHCKNSDQVTITVTGGVLSTDAISNKAGICSGDSLIISALPSGGSGTYTYIWSSKPAGYSSTQRADTLKPAINTKYYVTINDGFNTDIDSVSVNAYSKPTANAGRDTSICLDASVNMYASGGGTYLWHNGSTQNSISLTPPSSNRAYITVTNANNCTDTNSVGIQIYSLPIANAGNDSTIAETTIGHLNGSATGGHSPYSFLWAPASMVSNQNTAKPLTTALNAQQTFTLKVTDNVGCIDRDTVTISVERPAVVVINSDNPINNNAQVCLKDSLTLTANVSEGSGTFNYLWWSSPAGTNRTNANIKVSPNTNSDYYVRVLDIVRNDTVYDTIHVFIRPLPTAEAGIDTFVFKGGTVHVNASGGTSYRWTPAEYIEGDANLASPALMPDVDMLFYVEAITEFNCKNTDSIYVLVRDFQVFVPEAFTPNGDNTNDTCYVETLGIKSIVFKVYNRWGELVFETNEMGKGWDGSHRGVIQHSQTFGYTLKAVDLTDGTNEYKGIISIFR